MSDSPKMNRFEKEDYDKVIRGTIHLVNDTEGNLVRLPTLGDIREDTDSLAPKITVDLYELGLPTVEDLRNLSVASVFVKLFFQREEVEENEPYRRRVLRATVHAITGRHSRILREPPAVDLYFDEHVLRFFCRDKDKLTVEAFMAIYNRDKLLSLLSDMLDKLYPKPEKSEETKETASADDGYTVTETDDYVDITTPEPRFEDLDDSEDFVPLHKNTEISTSVDEETRSSDDYTTIKPSEPDEAEDSDDLKPVIYKD